MAADLTLKEKAIAIAVQRGIIKPEAAKAILEQDTPGPIEQIKKIGSDAWNLAQAGATGAADAVAGTIGFPGDLYNAANRQFSAGLPQAGGSGDVKELLQSTLGTEFKVPKTPGEKYVAAGAEGMTSMMPASKMQALVGTIMGLTGEAGANFLSDHPVIGRLLGQALPAGYAGYRSVRAPNKVSAARSAIDEAGGEQAIRDMETSRNAMENTLGERMLLSQGAKNESLDGIVNAITAVESGAPLRKILQRQLPAADDLARGFHQQIPGDLTQMGANKVQQAGAGAANAAYDARTAATQPGYRAAFNDWTQVQPLVTALDQAMVMRNLPPAAYPEFAKMRNIIATGMSHNGQIVRSLELKELAKIADAKFRQGVEPLAMKILRDEINNAIRPGSAGIQAGDAMHQAMTRGVIDPMENSAFSSMFPPGTRLEKKGDWNRLQKVIEDGNVTASDITTIGTLLRRQDPEAFPTLMKKSLQTRIDKALSNTKDIPQGDRFGRVAEEIAGNYGTEKRAAFEAQMTQIALARGQNPAEIVRGANEVIDALYGVSRSRGSVTPGAEPLREAVQSTPTRAMKTASFTAPLRILGWTIETKAYKNLIEDLSDALTSPNGAEKLIEIARWSRAQAIAKAALRGGNVMQSSQSQNEYLSSQVPQ